MGYSKANWEQNTSEYVPIIQILFIFYAKVIYKFFFSCFLFWGRGRDLYLIGMTLELQVRLR
jgi:hypothetical protein